MNVAVFDIDNTLAYDPNQPEENEFYLSDDYIINSLLPKKNVLDRLENYIQNGWSIIILTGRPNRLRKPTTTWLRKHLSWYNQLIMRPDHLDFEKISVYKTKELLTLSQKYEAVHFYEDYVDTLMMIGNVIHKAKLFRVSIDSIKDFDFWERPLNESKS